MKKVMLVMFLLIMIGTAGCYNDKLDKLYPISTSTATTCDTSTVSYSADIVPIINTNCAISGGCHDAAGVSESGYDFTSYAGVQSVASYGFIVTDVMGTPGKGHTAMPLNLPKISQCDINKITAWVNQGALNN